MEWQKCVYISIYIIYLYTIYIYIIYIYIYQRGNLTHQSQWEVQLLTIEIAKQIDFDEAEIMCRKPPRKTPKKWRPIDNKHHRIQSLVSHFSSATYLLLFHRMMNCEISPHISDQERRWNNALMNVHECPSTEGWSQRYLCHCAILKVPGRGSTRIWYVAVVILESNCPSVVVP